ncbi:MAG: arsenosugar biosynthesis radical SAM protein ArsS [Deltaproteobacteria bacterium]|nr:arsenosugar biosynthesis radical SAM protein ArsS [Deltaproteobacteria bacterium]
MCNQTCLHCHLEAGPQRDEIMSLETARQVVEFALKGDFQVLDITGGSPEMHPDVRGLVESLASCAPRVLFRSNLAALSQAENDDLVSLLRAHRIVIIGSLASTDRGQTESQRGKGSWERSLVALRKLNDLGYGVEGTGLELNLVSNPTGAFLPPPQSRAEHEFKRKLLQHHGIVFNNLYTFANSPLGRYKKWLIESGNYESYMQRLETSFNPSAVDHVMCRSLVSVSWDGFLYDCDFNQVLGLHLGARRRHVSEVTRPVLEGIPITTADHCYACTAGSGFG